MKRDIQINYSVLEDIKKKTDNYKESLKTIEGVLNNVNGKLRDENEGEAIEALKASYEELENYRKSCYDEVAGISEQVGNYITGMRGIIDAIDESQMVRVDRDDIWWNMQAIIRECKGVTSKNRSIRTSHNLFTEDEDVKKEEENYRKIEEIRNILDRYKGRFETHVEEMNNLFNKKVPPFEDKDDAYAKVIETLYDKVSSQSEKGEDRREWLWDTTKSFGEAILDGVKGLFGLANSLVIGAVSYLGAGIGVCIEAVTGDVPEILQDDLDRAKKYNEIIGATLDDPLLLIEGFAQGASDSYEEKGIGYAVGNIAFDLALAKGAKGFKSANMSYIDEFLSIRNPENLKTNMLDEYGYYLKDVSKPFDITDIAEGNKLTYNKYGIKQNNVIYPSVFNESQLSEVNGLRMQMASGQGPTMMGGTGRVVSEVEVSAGKTVDDVVDGSRVTKGVSNPNNKVFTSGKKEWIATRPKGTQQTYEVYQRNDIDWNMARTSGDKNFIGKTNAEAASRGLAPQLADGNFATLHHIGQDSRGAIAEASTRYHGVGKYGQDILHSQYGRSTPNPYFPIDRKKFGVDTREYWKWRVNN